MKIKHLEAENGNVLRTFENTFALKIHYMTILGAMDINWHKSTKKVHNDNGWHEYHAMEVCFTTFSF